MTYSIDGRQYLVVAVSGGAYSGEYIAFACHAISELRNLKTGIWNLESNCRSTEILDFSF